MPSRPGRTENLAIGNSVPASAGLETEEARDDEPLRARRGSLSGGVDGRMRARVSDALEHQPEHRWLDGERVAIPARRPPGRCTAGGPGGGHRQ